MRTLTEVLSHGDRSEEVVSEPSLASTCKAEAITTEDRDLESEKGGAEQRGRSRAEREDRRCVPSKVLQQNPRATVKARLHLQGSDQFKTILTIWRCQFRPSGHLTQLCLTLLRDNSLRFLFFHLDFQVFCFVLFCF